MTELKTLKELDLDEYPDHRVKAMLREEAINWCKFGKQQIFDEAGQNGANENIIRLKGGIDSFKRFFEITEGDLK